jgi:hypothetical protein
MNLHLVCVGGEDHRLRSLVRSVREFIGMGEERSWKLPASPARILTQVNSQTAHQLPTRGWWRPPVEGVEPINSISGLNWYDH